MPLLDKETGAAPADPGTRTAVLATRQAPIVDFRIQPPYISSLNE